MARPPVFSALPHPTNRRAGVPPAGGPRPRPSPPTSPQRSPVEVCGPRSTPRSPIRLALARALLALAPLVVYRLAELGCSRLLPTAWGLTATHLLPPLGMLATALLVWRRIPPLVPPARSGHWGRPGPAVALGMLLGSAAALLNLLISLAARDQQGMLGLACIASVMPPAPGALVVHVMLLAPLAEEVAFRGVLYRVLRSAIPPLLAGLGSALVFGMMHGALTAALWAFFLGLLTAFAYEESRSLLAPVTIHALFNAVPVGVAVLRARPDDTGPVWLAVAAVGVVFTLCARSAHAARVPDSS